METTSVRSVLVICLVLGILVGETTAKFKDCYEGCIITCLLVDKKNVALCAVKCLKDCIFKSFTMDKQNENHYFCRLGCASSLCTKISSIESPDGDKVESCVDSCSQRCTKNYLA